MEIENEQVLAEKVEELRMLIYGANHSCDSNGKAATTLDCQSSSSSQKVDFANIQNSFEDDSSAIYSCLLCNKCNVQRAYDAYRTYKRMQYTHKMEWIDPLDVNVRRELLSGKFTIVPASFNDSGCREHLCFFFGHLHSPLAVTPRDTIKMILLQLNALLKLSKSLQLVTVALIVDLSQSHYSNFDMTLCTSLLYVIKNTFPLRVSRIFVIGMPSTLETNRKIVSRFLKSKIRERIIFLNTHVDLMNYMPSPYIPRNFLPQADGPNLSHESWLRHCFQLLGEYNRVLKELPNYFSLDDSKTATMISSAFLSRRFSSNSLQRNGILANNCKFQSINRRSASFHTVHMNHLHHQRLLAEKRTAEHLPHHQSTNSGGMNGSSSPVCKASIISGKLLPPPPPPSSSSSSSAAAVISDAFITRQQQKQQQLPISVANGHGDWEFLSHNYDSPVAADESSSSGDSSEDSVVDEVVDVHSPFATSFATNASNSRMQKFLQSPEIAGFTIHQFKSYIEKKGEEGLLDEYDQLCQIPLLGSFRVCRLNSNRYKCRYSDVPCMDETRVRLPPDDEFIHANWVDGYNQKKAFISAQGPLESTSEDFWHMVWSYDVPIIVMTTNLYEKEKLKCHPYWPAEDGKIMQFGAYTIENNGVERNPNFTIVKLKLFKKKEKRKLIHYHFTMWPDYDIPESPVGFLDFVQRIQATYDGLRSMVNKVNFPPIIVHCSAGIGRTGTFIVIDICIRRLNTEGLVDIYNVSRKLRMQRPGSIQMPRQYLFCYLAVLAYSQRQGS